MRLTEITERRLFARTIELLPPGFDIADPNKEPTLDMKAKFRQLVEKARIVEQWADAIHIADLRDSSRYRMNSVTTAVDLKHETGLETIPTIALRDYSKNVIYGLLFHALRHGIENFLLVRGDRYSEEEEQHSTNVYDVNRVSQLVRLVKEVSSRSGDKLCILGPINLNRRPRSEYLWLARERQDSGTDIFLSQPIFEEVETCLERVDKVRSYGIDRPIFHNIFPLKNYEDSLYCERRFGLKIPKRQKEKVRDGGAEEGLRMASERYHRLLENRKRVDGVYISSRGVAESVVKILS